jgi:uncharacterized membrane protein
MVVPHGRASAGWPDRCQPATVKGRRTNRDHLPELGVAAAFLVSGTLHFLRPRPFVRIVPRVLPRAGTLVFLSGLAELGCAAGLVRGDRWAGPASAALLVAVLPGNIQMALDATAEPGASRWWVAALWLRVPLQLPMIRAALRARRA